MKVNLSKGAPSLSLGRPGATVNIGKRRVRSTLGIPGTGISYVAQHSSGPRSRSTPLPSPRQPGNRKWALPFPLGERPLLCPLSAAVISHPTQMAFLDTCNCRCGCQAAQTSAVDMGTGSPPANGIGSNLSPCVPGNQVAEE